MNPIEQIDKILSRLMATYNIEEYRHLLYEVIKRCNNRLEAISEINVDELVAKVPDAFKKED
jgi:hypothetical protein